MGNNKLAVLRLKVEKAQEKANQANEKLYKAQKVLREYLRIENHPITILGITPRLTHTLRRANIATVEEFLEMLKVHGTGIYTIRQFGAKSMEEMIESLIRCGFSDRETLEKMIHPPQMTYQEWIDSIGSE